MKPKRAKSVKQKIVQVIKQSAVTPRAQETLPYKEKIEQKEFIVCDKISCILSDQEARVGRYIFTRNELARWKYEFRLGTSISVRAVRSCIPLQRNKRDYPVFPLAIVERLDRDLRTLSDMRTKPAWRSLPWLEPAIDAIYAERDRMTRETKIPHEVDHCYPIMGINPPSCGLTVPWNLNVIPATENRRKSNKLVI